MSALLDVSDCIQWMADHDGECLWAHGGFAVHVSACRDWDGLRVATSARKGEATERGNLLLFVVAVRKLAAEIEEKRPR